MHLLIRGCGALGVFVAMRAARSGLAATLMADDAFEAERLTHALQGLTDIEIRTEQQGLPQDVNAALAPPAVLPDVPLRFALAAPGGPIPDGAAAVHIHKTLAEVSLAKMCLANRQQVLSLLECLALPVMEVPDGATCFAGLALLDRLAALADHCLLLGAVPWEVDSAMEAFGFETGVFAAQDAAGLDLSYARRQAGAAAPLLVTDRMVREGRLGRGAGVGWYRYPGGGGAVIDPLMEDMAVEEARFASIAQRTVPDEEVMIRLLLGLACRGAELLSDGNIADAAQLHMLCQLVLGYPEERGGILAWVQSMGHDTASGRLTEFSDGGSALWPPQALLEQLVK